MKIRFHVQYLLGVAVLYGCTAAADVCTKAAKESVNLAIVKVDTVDVFNKPYRAEKYKAGLYKLGRVLTLDGCNRYDWCKIKGTKLYIPKSALGIMCVKRPRKKMQSEPNMHKKSSVMLQKYFLMRKKALRTEQPKQKRNKTPKKCIEFRSILIEEDELCNEEKDFLVKNYTGKCITAKSLKQMLHDLSACYVQHGYITTKPYLPEQNIAEGTVRFAVTKGYVSKVINKETKSSDGRTITAFLGQEGEVLNLRELETALEMMNRVASYHSTFKIIPGKETGQSIVEIETKKETPYHLILGVIGEKQGYDDNPNLSVDFSVDNPLNINDILTFRYNGSRIQKEYQSSTGMEVEYSFPLGSYVTVAKWFEFQYSQNVIGLNDEYIANGDTQGANVRVSKVVYRNKNNKFEIAGSLEYKNNRNYFENQLIDVSSYVTTLAQADLVHTYFSSWGQLKSVLSYHKGTNWFGARDDSYYNGNDEKLQFEKLTLNETFICRLPKSFQIVSNWHLQYTQDLLYDSNKLRVGSYYTVRGYSSSYYGNNAYYLHNDLIRNFSTNLSKTYLASVSPFVGFDYGEVRCERNTENACGSLAGSSIGIKTASLRLNSEFALSRAVKRIEGMEYENLFRYNITLKF